MIYAFEEYELDVPRYELRYAGKLVDSSRRCSIS